MKNKVDLTSIPDVDFRHWFFIESTTKDETAWNYIDTLSNYIARIGDRPSEGGPINDDYNITVPNSTKFISFSYKGDLAGWKEYLAKFASDINRKSGFVKDGLFYVSDGNHYTDDECLVEEI